MELSEFLKNFAEQFEETDHSSITAETLFHDLDEYSSLLALSLIAMVDEEYDVALKGEDISNSKTVKDLFDIVKSRI